MSQNDKSGRRGDMGKFIVHVQHRQNNTWQGKITWVEEGKTVCFRSMWEMIKLIGSAVDTVDNEDEEPLTIDWETME